jgi:hypothetical protein
VNEPKNHQDEERLKPFAWIFRKGPWMKNLKPATFNSGVVVTVPAEGSQQTAKDFEFCYVSAEAKLLLTGAKLSQPARRFAPEVVVTKIFPGDHHEDSAFHESDLPAFETHLEGDSWGFEAVVDQQLLDKWCRIPS